MTRTIYMLNSKLGKEVPLYTFTTQDDLEWYVTWQLSCSTKEYHAIMNAFEGNVPFQATPNLQYVIKNGE